MGSFLHREQRHPHANPPGPLRGPGLASLQKAPWDGQRGQNAGWRRTLGQSPSPIC